MSSSPLPEIPALGYLADVPQEHRAFLTGYGTFVRPTDGERIITEGDSQDSLYLVLKGTLHVTSNADGRAVLLASLKEGETLGEINIFDPTAASANVTSIGECLIWKLTREDLESIFDADPLVANLVLKGILKQVSRRVRRMNEKLLANEKEVFFDFWAEQSSEE
ncbi:MAG: cyclic nucleotide-binding domain-containing protein [Akkermansiaceae bacterium]|nr:cyclic nucleotide-binding domain-containing protein [Akkermansiaceae bacterium]